MAHTQMPILTANTWLATITVATDAASWRRAGSGCVF